MDMLDINFIRENDAVIADAAKRKGIKFDIYALIKLDDERRKFLQEVEEMKSRQNEASKKIAILDGKEREKILSDMKIVKESLQKSEEKLKETMERWKKMMLEVPNIPDVSVPEGVSEDENVEEKVWGDKPTFDFEAKDHMELMENLGMVDFERGTKVHGFRGYFLRGDGVRLSMAIWNYALDFYSKKDFIPFMAPSVVHKQFFYGTGHLPNEAEDLFETQDGDNLSGTAEVPMMAYHSDEIIQREDLPKKYLAFSPCYRREAGSHGKDIKGLIRVHEFYKWEQLVLCEASHDESVKYFEEINANMEEFIESLAIPYRRLLICTGDLSQSKVKQYDTELWVPKENKYREISSASYFHDFQSRRFNIRYRDTDGDKKIVHSMNATAIPTPRILVSLLENFQQADGSIKIPEKLVPYFGKDTISKKN
ncbi:MAG: serine--tRNA ligase [Candidatus Pacebacteria bacterium]|nr:serine--tRNA ligase [Candidatus Paceibacterota bacterium]